MPETPVPQIATKSRTVPWMALSAVVMAIAIAILVITGDSSTDLVSELGSQIRCPVCQGVPIADSPSQMATDMMEILREEVAAGATRQEAIDALVGAYPGSLLLDPPFSAASVALWLIPAMAVAVGLGLAATVRRTRDGYDQPTERAGLAHSVSQVRSDLDALAGQEASGDIEPDAASHLRAAYLAELAETEKALATSPELPEPPTRSRRRSALGAAIVVGALAVVVVVAGAFIVDRPGSGSGVASSLQGDPSDYSNETLAAVIEANLDNPAIDGMRMALAERYFSAGDYPAAFPYYLDVASSDKATTEQAATALSRLGWMAFDGNGETDTALDLIGQARDLMPSDPFPLYLEALVLWCGKDDTETAAENLERVLRSDDLDASIRSQIQAEYEQAAAGTACGTETS